MFFLWLALGAAASCLADDPASDAVTGTWVAAEKDAYIEIYRQDDRYFGKISWLRDQGEEKPGARQDTRMHETPRVGLVILCSS